MTVLTHPLISGTDRNIPERELGFTEPNAWRRKDLVNYLRSHGHKVPREDISKDDLLNQCKMLVQQGTLPDPAKEIRKDPRDAEIAEMKEQMAEMTAMIQAQAAQNTAVVAGRTPLKVVKEEVPFDAAAADWNSLRKEAKSRGIKAFQKTADELRELLS